MIDIFERLHNVLVGCSTAQLDRSRVASTATERAKPLPNELGCSARHQLLFTCATLGKDLVADGPGKGFLEILLERKC